MIRGLFDLVDAGDGKTGVGLYLFNGVARDRAHFRMDFTDGQFDFQPLLELRVSSDQSAPISGKCVAFDHWFGFIRRFRRLSKTKEVRYVEILSRQAPVVKKIPAARTCPTLLSNLRNQCNLRNLRITS